MTPLLVAIGYLLLLLGLGLVSRRYFRGTSRDFFVASRSIGPFVLLMSLFGTTMTAFALVGSTGKAFERGIGVFGLMASISALIHVAVFFFLGLRLWAIGKRHGFVTQVQYFRARFGSAGIGYALFPCLVLLVIPYLLIGILGAGNTLLPVTAGAFPDLFPNPETPQWTGGIPVWLTGLVVSGVVLIYVFLGGSRGAAWANTFQTLVFILTGLVAFAFIAQALGGFRQAALMTPRFDDKGRLIQSHRYDEAQGGMVPRPEPTSAGAFQRSQRYDERRAVWDPNKVVQEADGFLGHYVVSEGETSTRGGRRVLFIDPRENRFLLSGDPELVEGKRPLLSRTPLKVLGSDGSPIGDYGINPWIFFTYLFIPLSAGMFPHLFQNWLTARSARSFRLTFSAYPLCMLLVWVPCVLIGVWATGILDPAHKPNAVLGEMVRLLVDSPLLTGLLTAGILAAIMSSLDSQFLSLSTMFTNDIVLHAVGREGFTDRQIVWMARCFVALVVLVTFLLSLAAPADIFNLGVWCFTGFSALTPLVVASLYWRRTTLAGAYASLATAVVSWIWFFAASGFGGEYSVGPGIHPAAICVIASALVLVAVSLLTRPPDAGILDRFLPPSRKGAEPQDTGGRSAPQS